MYNDPNFNSSQDLCLDWNDTIESDGGEYILLPDCDYNLVVKNFERGRFPGGPKLPPSNKATITLVMPTLHDEESVKFDFILHRNLEWRISSFFRAIGQKKHGERLTMNWNTLIGSSGRARFKQRSYTGNDGTQRFTNDVDRFYDYDPEFFKGEGWTQLADTDELPWK